MWSLSQDLVLQYFQKSSHATIQQNPVTNSRQFSEKQTTLYMDMSKFQRQTIILIFQAGLEY